MEVVSKYLLHNPDRDERVKVADMLKRVGAVLRNRRKNRKVETANTASLSFFFSFHTSSRGHSLVLQRVDPIFEAILKN